MNHYTMIGFVFLNLFCIGYFSYFDPERWIFYLLLVSNLLLLWYNIRLNGSFWNEHEKLFGNFSEFIKNNTTTPIHFPESEQFDENAKFLSLFKRTYIEQNLLKKDYKELR